MDTVLRDLTELADIFDEHSAPDDAVILRNAIAEIERLRAAADGARVGAGLATLVLQQSYGPPSSWPGDYPKGWRHPPGWPDDRRPTPEEACWHDNGVRDVWFAVRQATAAKAEIVGEPILVQNALTKVWFVLGEDGARFELVPAVGACVGAGSGCTQSDH